MKQNELFEIINKNISDDNKLLRDKKLINQRDINGMTPIFYSLKLKKDNYFNIMLPYCDNPYLVDSFGFTLLHYASSFNYNCTKKIVDNFGLIDFKSCEWPAIFLAISFNHEDIVKYLLNYSFDEQALIKGPRNISTLSFAIAHHKNKIAEHLIATSKNLLETKDILEWTPLFYASYFKNIEMYEFLKKNHEFNINHEDIFGNSFKHYKQW